jgi:hypothetical protein
MYSKIGMLLGFSPTYQGKSWFILIYDYEFGRIQPYGIYQSSRVTSRKSQRSPLNDRLPHVKPMAHWILTGEIPTFDAGRAGTTSEAACTDATQRGFGGEGRASLRCAAWSSGVGVPWDESLEIGDFTVIKLGFQDQWRLQDGNMGSLEESLWTFHTVG